MRIAIIAAEPSGDLLGAGLMAELRKLAPDVIFEGIGGDKMLDQGMSSLAPLDALSVMGLVEVLRHLPRLLRLRADLQQRWLSNPPDLFIGVDAPDFNLTLEQRLREAGVPTVHYVCPTVWAWRSGRVKKIRAAADLLLSIFPFEPEFLRKHGVRSEYVGHTLAAQMPLEVDQAAARSHLQLPAQSPVLAILPGSRSSEVGRLTKPFLQTALACREALPNLQFAVPLATEKTRDLWHEVKQKIAPDLAVSEVLHDTQSVLAAADVVLTASGTATFEALLSKRPMVVGYKLNSLTYWILRFFRLVKLKQVSMANLLSEHAFAPEFIQAHCEPKQLAPAVLEFFAQPEKVAQIQQHYREVHTNLVKDTDFLAAQAVMRLLAERREGHLESPN